MAEGKQQKVNSLLPAFEYSSFYRSDNNKHDDKLKVNPLKGNFIVADGTSGTPGSDRAAWLACRIVDKYTLSPIRVHPNSPDQAQKAMKNAVTKAHETILQRRQSRFRRAIGKTTLAAVQILPKVGDMIPVAWGAKGDSPILLQQPDEELWQVNKSEATLYGEHPECLGSHTYFGDEVQSGIEWLKPGSKIVVGSDGIIDNDSALGRIQRSLLVPSAEVAARNIVAFSKAPDEATAITIFLK